MDRDPLAFSRLSGVLAVVHKARPGREADIRPGTPAVWSCVALLLLLGTKHSLGKFLTLALDPHYHGPTMHRQFVVWFERQNPG
jgi:hypothetical protein